jgi:hypothetical protein
MKIRKVSLPQRYVSVHIGCKTFLDTYKMYPKLFYSSLFVVFTSMTISTPRQPIIVKIVDDTEDI